MGSLSPDIQRSGGPERPQKGGAKNLHISHSWGGGIHRWVHDFCSFDRERDNLVLESLGTRECYGIGYRLVEGASRRELQRWVLKYPISETRIQHQEYRTILETIRAHYDVDHIVLSCLVGHSLDVFDLGLPMTKIHHDYYPYCPNIYTYFGRPCAGCDLDEFTDCLKNNPVDFANNKCSTGYWLNLREAYVEALSRPEVDHVCPSDNVVANLEKLDPRLGRLPLTVIPHGINLTKKNSFGGAEEGRKLRVAILGTQHIVKGMKLLEEVFDRTRLVADFTFLGGGPEGTSFMSRYGVRYIERYEHSELSTLIQEGAFDLALFTSTFPETFCYTLSEVWAHSIPPCARSVGSFLDRIHDGEDGFLIGPDGEDIVDFLLKIDCNRHLLRDMSRRLKGTPVRSVAAMLEDYSVLRAQTGLFPLPGPAVDSVTSDDHQPHNTAGSHS
ncbi:MAG: hypothetical protein ABFS37_00260 [Acidobacteriota bacterium]